MSCSKNLLTPSSTTPSSVAETPQSRGWTSIGSTAPPVRDLTDQLVRREQEDLGELKKLQRTVRDLKDTTLWSLLVNLMRHDTEKHIDMLRFVREHT